MKTIDSLRVLKYPETVILWKINELHNTDLLHLCFKSLGSTGPWVKLHLHWKYGEF